MSKKTALRQQIEAMAENFCETFLDAYQCADWGVNAQRFARLCIDELTKQLTQLAHELDDERLEDGEEE
jgi:hypothetical protein